MGNIELSNMAPVLFVKDAPRARDFYTGILGLKVKTNFGQTNFIFEEGFALWQPMEDNIIPVTVPREKIHNKNAAPRFEICFETGDLDAVFQKLKQAGVKFLHEINEEAWGQRTIRFYDPDRHLVEVGEELRIFVKRVYERVGRSVEATAGSCFMEPALVRQLLGL